MAFKSRDDMVRAVTRSKNVEIETSDLRFLLARQSLNALLFTDPFSKICFNGSAVSEFLRNGDVLYIDLDSVFTAYVKNEFFLLPHSNELTLYLPSANEFEKILADVCSRINGKVALIVVDSLNSFYHLYDRGEIGPLNHLLSSYVSLLLSHASKYGSVLLVTSMIRHKKTTEWVLAPASKRLIESRSNVILKADFHNNALVIDLLKHEELKEGAKLLLPNQKIPITI